MINIKCPDCGRTMSFDKENMERVSVLHILDYPTISGVSTKDMDDYTSIKEQFEKRTCSVCGIEYSGKRYQECPLCSMKGELDKATKKILALEKNNNREKVRYLNEQIVILGNYKGTPIRWIVLCTDRMNGRALLISEKTLEQKKYHEQLKMISWNQSGLRQWLNGDFYYSAFQEEERHIIRLANVKNLVNGKIGLEVGKDSKDKIFCLSVDEAKGYFANKKYIKAQNENGMWSRWWLRTPGDNSVYATYVGHTGEIETSGCCLTDKCMVRPAMWVDLSWLEKNSLRED